MVGHRAESSNAPAPSIAPATIQKLAGAVPQALAMLAAMELDIFSALHAGSLSLQEAAQVIGVRPDRLQPVLAVLVSAALLTVDGELFANTPEADHYLVRGQPAYMGSVHELWADMWHAELRTARSVRTGIPQARHDFASMAPEALYAFVRGSHSGAQAAGRQLAEAGVLEGCHTLLDIGGGSGGLSIELTRSMPSLRAIVFELPPVAPIARLFVDEAGAGEQVQVVAADVVAERVPCQGDVAVCNRFIQVLSPQRALQALRHIRDALTPGGRLLIVGHILDDSSLSPPAAVAFGLLALNLYEDGAAFSESEHRDWMTAAGFGAIERRMLPNGYSLMSGRKPL